MDSINGDIVQDFFPFFRVYKDGRVERFIGTDTIPPSSRDPKTGVSSKDVIIIPETSVSARLYLPNSTTDQKLPLLIYIHGGGFCIESAFSPAYHHHLNSIAAEAKVVVVSVEYRLAPEHPLPIAYNDSWAAIQWVLSHSMGEGPEVWLRDYVDFGRVFFGGDSAGANIAHNMALRAGDAKLAKNVELLGVIIIHPYFWGEERIGSEASNPGKEMAGKLWHYICPSTTGCDDPLINPVAVEAQKLSGLVCTRVLVCVGEKDMFRDRGWLYYEKLKNSGWGGVVEIMETEGEDHVFHLFNPTCEKALIMMKRLTSFLNKV